MAIGSIFNIAGSALVAQSQRMNVAASNLANINSAAGPDGQPYRAKAVIFAPRNTSQDGIGGVKVRGVVESQAPFPMKYRPDSPLANDEGYVKMPNVNPTSEMVDMISAARSYKANVNVLQTSKNLMLRTLSLGSK